MPAESLLPEIVVTQEEYDLEPSLKLNLDMTIIGKLYNPDECAASLLEAMYWQFRAAPLYWGRNPEVLTRRVYSQFHLDSPGFTDEYPDGILPNKGGERALTLFSQATQTSYHYEFRKTSTGRKAGITLYIINPTAAAIDYANTPGGQAYLRDAYKFLLPSGIVIDNIIFEDSIDNTIGVHMFVTAQGFTP